LPVTDFNDLHLDQKGPAFFMLAGQFSRLVTALLPGWSEINGWHLANFLAFQVGIISLYSLVRRWTGNWAAFGAALLFSTQPLFWGHAFINPKDIPFMSFFLASAALGLRMIDRLNADPFSVSYSAVPLQSFREDWRQASVVQKTASCVLFLLWLGLGLLAWINRDGINNAVAMLVKGIYNSQGFWGRLFLKVAPNAGRHGANCQSTVHPGKMGSYLFSSCGRSTGSRPVEAGFQKDLFPTDGWNIVAGWKSHPALPGISCADSCCRCFGTDYFHPPISSLCSLPGWGLRPNQTREAASGGFHSLWCVGVANVVSYLALSVARSNWKIYR
jgi:hypothetical protein